MFKNVNDVIKLSVLSLMLGIPTAQAQSTDGSAQASAGALDEVVVTAQRRSESLQDAAVPVEAFNQDVLTQTGMESAQDLGALSPALGVSGGGGPLTSLFVRGVGALTVNPLTDAAIAQNVDGIYLGRSSGAAGQALFDLERVELLKGPQGTLYGRNATGGVVNFIPKKPVLGENSGYLQGEFGNYSKIGLQGALNVALSDNSAMRISANGLDRDGYSDDGTNDKDAVSLRGQYLIEPNDSLSIRIAADYTELDGKGAGGDLIGTYGNYPRGNPTEFTPSGLPRNSGPTAAGANALRAQTLHTPSFAYFKPIDAADLYQDLSFSGVMAEINYQTDAGTLTFIPAYRESEQDYQFAGPGFAPAKTAEENSQTSYELRFATDSDGPLNGILGAFYIEEDISTSGVFAQNYASPIQNYDNGGESWAVFGQGTFEVSDTFRLNAGIRYTEDEKYVRGISDTFVTFCGGPAGAGQLLTAGTTPSSFAHGCPGLPPHPVTSDRDAFIAYFVENGLIAAGSVATVPGMGAPPRYDLLQEGNTVGVPIIEDGENVVRGGENVTSGPQLGSIVNVGDGALTSDLDYDEVTYRLSAEWDVGPDSLAYVNFETGYRAGGVDLSTASPTYEPEYIDAYTIGSKNRFWDNTLQVNAEAFYWEYTDQQVTYFTTLGNASSFPIANADATIKGLDIDVVWAATANTTFSGNVQMLDSVYDELQLVSDAGRGRFGCASEGIISAGAGPGDPNVEGYDCSGSSLLYSPDTGADLGVNHIVNLSNHELSLTATASYRSSQQTNFLLLDDTEADSYVTWNLDATLSPADASWALSAYVRNATDEQYTTNTNVSNRGLAYAVFSPPQTYGIRLRANF